MLDEGEFRRIRACVLAQWPTGADVEFDEAVAYHQTIPAKRCLPNRLSRAKKKGETLIQPRAGVALPEEHIKLLQYLEREGGADLLPTTIDSYTRQNLYEEAAKGIEESRTEGRSLLNGFPAVNHGVAVCRRVNESVDLPVQVRHGTPDARLLAEISFAGGFTSYEGGGISYNIPYAKRAPLTKTIEDWKYVDRLVGLLRTKGHRYQPRAFRAAHRNTCPAMYLPFGGRAGGSAGRRAGRQGHHAGLRAVRQPRAGCGGNAHAGNAGYGVPG
jgi:methylaspartate mutase epsilon subunit